MFGYDWFALSGVAVAMLAGGLAKGVTAIGLPIIFLVIAVNFVPPQTALAIITIPILVTNLWQASRGPSILEPAKRFWPMLVAFVICMYIGSLIAASVDSATMFLLIGISVLIFTVSQFVTPMKSPLNPVLEKVLGPFVGVVAGLMGGISTVWGPPIMMYLFSLHLPKDMWTRSIGAIYLIGAVPLTIFYWKNGILNPDNIWLSVAACVPVMIGTLIGESLRKYVNEALFRKILLFALFIMALNLLRRALF